jgi:hypothetical protein
LSLACRHPHNATKQLFVLVKQNVRYCQSEPSPDNPDVESIRDERTSVREKLPEIDKIVAIVDHVSIDVKVIILFACSLFQNNLYYMDEGQPCYFTCSCRNTTNQIASNDFIII